MNIEHMHYGERGFSISYCGWYVQSMLKTCWNWLLCRLYNYHSIYGLQNDFTASSARCTLPNKLLAWFNSPSFLFQYFSFIQIETEKSSLKKSIRMHAFTSTHSVYNNNNNRGSVIRCIQCIIDLTTEISLANGIMKITHWKCYLCKFHWMLIDVCIEMLSMRICEIPTIKSHLLRHQNISILLKLNSFWYHSKH